MTVRRPPVAVGVYCRLLRLYPAEFRRLFAADMAADIADGYGAVRAGGRNRAVRFLWRAYGDLVVSLGREALADDRVTVAAWSLSGSGLLWGVTVWMLAREWPGGPARAGFYAQLLVVFAVLGVAACAAVARIMRPGDSPRLVPIPDARPARRPPPRGGTAPPPS